MAKVKYAPRKSPKGWSNYNPSRENFKPTKMTTTTNINNKITKKKKNKLITHGYEFMILDFINDRGEPKFEILLMSTKIKEIVNMRFFDTEDKFKKLRHFIKFNLKQEINGVKYKASNFYQERLMEYWIDANGHMFEPITARQAISCASSDRSTRYKSNDKLSIVKEIKNNNEQIDLTKENAKIEPRRIKLRKQRREYVKKIVMEIDNDGNNENDNNDINQPSNKNKDTFISRENLKNKKTSKEEFRKINSKIKYEVNKELDNCFLYALRHISNAFPLDIFIDKFRGKNIDKQIAIANHFLLEEEGKILKRQCSYFGTLKSIKEMMKGKLILMFVVGDVYHVEGLVEGEYGKDIQKNILDMEDQEMLIEIFSLSK